MKAGKRSRTQAGRGPEGLTNKSVATLPPVCAACTTLWSKFDNARHHNKTKENPFSEKGSEAWSCWETLGEPPPTITTDINEHSDEGELQKWTKLKKRFDFTLKRSEFKEVDVKKILLLKWNKKTAGKLRMESIITAANPSLLCEPKRSKVCFTEAKVTQCPNLQRGIAFQSVFSDLLTA